MRHSRSTTLDKSEPEIFHAVVISVDRRRTGIAVVAFDDVGDAVVVRVEVTEVGHAIAIGRRLQAGHTTSVSMNAVLLIVFVKGPVVENTTTMPTAKFDADAKHWSIVVMSARRGAEPGSRNRARRPR